MTMPTTPQVTAASPSVAASTTSVDDDATNDDVEEEAPVSSLYCRVYFESEKAGSKDLRVLFAMAEGHDGLSFPKHTDPPFIESKIYVKQIKPNRQILQAEVSRRFKAYISQGKEPKPSAWTIAACSEWLFKNKIPSNEEFQDELRYIKTELIKYRTHVTNMVLSEKQQPESVHVSKNWCNQLPFLRLYHVFMDEEIRHKLVTLNVVKSREAIDARNSVKGGTNFFEDAAAKFNDANFVPESMALPDLHVDFTVSLKLYLSVDEMNAEDLQRGYRTQERRAHPTHRRKW
jgi:hypothetical protein